MAATLATLRTGISAALAAWTGGTNDLSVADAVVWGQSMMPPSSLAYTVLIAWPKGSTDGDNHMLNSYGWRADVVFSCFAAAATDTPVAKLDAALALVDDVTQAVQAGVLDSGSALHDDGFRYVEFDWAPVDGAQIDGRPPNWAQYDIVASITWQRSRGA